MSRIRVGLSTASVWPQTASAAFTLAGELGYDGVEVMVWADPLSQNVPELLRRSRRAGVPVLAVHAPCLLVTQRIWSPDPETRLRRAVEAAQDLDAPTVVVHPPFRWQRKYADGFAELVADLEGESGVAVAVENMFPVRRGVGMRSVEVTAFRPSIDPTDVGHRNYTLDLSHTAAANMDALALADRMGKGLTHVHLADGTGLPKDEHLVPGRGTQPCVEICRRLVDGGFEGQVVLEVSTRRARTAADRARDLAESLQFARKHLAES
ncbi:sugar phosphate isomerase/epimerase [Actinokineospora auranticolor]|uniref:Sugar phosphate isomerase/epimerase n=1 Tax=Actinokineospora auranticolor TaxID=155976 RepID=A0A2S6GHA1_9PSEU|nr:sugar phosphate isomerase/epimerase [Actinokineospora auranticolor]PPK64580.1 sugar phosphate isomerase/epimerase [Actinokineospora auranticolor]